MGGENTPRARKKAKALELKIFNEVVSEISSHIGRIQATADALAVLDVLSSFAGISEEMGYVKPDMTDNDTFIVEEGRHPVIEKKTFRRLRAERYPP